MSTDTSNRKDSCVLLSPGERVGHLTSVSSLSPCQHPVKINMCTVKPLRGTGNKPLLSLILESLSCLLLNVRPSITHFIINRSLP